MKSMICECWRFQLLGEGILRIEWAENGIFNDRPTAIVEARPAPRPILTCESKNDDVIVSGGPFQIHLSPDATPFDPSPGIQIKWSRGGKCGVWRPGLAASNLGGFTRGQDVCGLGQRHPRLKDGLLSRAGWYLLDDSRTPLLDENQNLVFRDHTSRIDWYLFVYGEDYAAALRDLAVLLGNPPMVPKKTLGFWWSRWHAYSEKDVKNLARQFRETGMPLSVLVLDMDWHKDGWCHWDWNPELIPDPKKLIEWCHKQGMLVTLNVHPHEILPTDSHFEKFCDRARVPQEKRKELHLINIADPLQRKITEDLLIKPFHEQGMDFWWIDGDSAHLGAPLSNQFWTNKVYFDAAKKARPGKRAMVFSRCGGWGSQRFPIGFSGDTHSEWHVLKYLVPFTASGGNIGFHFWSNDTGGFWGEHLPDDLYVRWFQFSALSPILRMHCSHGDREPWSYNTHAQSIVRRFYELRARLEPYLYTAMAECTEKNLPLCRPLYISLSQDPCAYEHPEEYFLGPDLLCAPVCDPQVTEGGIRAVYFPEGLWWNYFTGDAFRGPAVRRIYSSLSRMPLFIRAGAPIPMIREKGGPRSLEFLLFPGACGSGSVYEDDGETIRYEQGEFARLEAGFVHKGNSAEFQAGPWQGKFAGKASRRDHSIVIRTPDGYLRRSLKPLSNNKEVRATFRFDRNMAKKIEMQVFKSDLIRRAQVARSLEERIGAPDRILDEYDQAISQNPAPLDRIRRLLKQRLDHYTRNPVPDAGEIFESLVQELLGIHAELRVSDAEKSDALLVTSRVWPCEGMSERSLLDIEWNLPGDWRARKPARLSGIPLSPETPFSSQLEVHAPLSYNPLGRVDFTAEMTLSLGKRSYTFHPKASLDLSGIREVWVAGTFDLEKGGMEKTFGPEKGFDPNAEYQGKYGSVRWRHVRIPIDSRDAWGNVPILDIRKILDFSGIKEIAFLHFRVHSEKKGRFNLAARMDDPGDLWINGNHTLSLTPFNKIYQINLEKGENDFILKMLRWWGEWEAKIAVVSFANCGPAEGLIAPRLV